MKAKQWLLILSCVSGCGAQPGAKQTPQAPQSYATSRGQSGAMDQQEPAPADPSTKRKSESAGAPAPEAAPAAPPPAAVSRSEPESRYAEAPPAQGARDQYNRAS